MDVEYFISLGNFKEKELNKGKNILNSLNVRFYSDDNFTSIPYEILDYNDTGVFIYSSSRIKIFQFWERSCYIEKRTTI